MLDGSPAWPAELAAAAWNTAPDRRGKGRAKRMPDGAAAPPPFAHRALHGEVRVEWEPRSALYNTDGQVFSDVGVPVVRAAVTAIAIETVADAACAPSL